MVTEKDQHRIITCSNLTYKWKKSQQNTIQIDSLIVNRGEHLFIQGASGSGKTTLLNLITGMILPDSGTIEILNHQIEKLTSTQRDRFRADHLGVIFQQFNLIPYLSVIENVTLPCRFSGARKKRVEDLHQKAMEILTHLGIPEEKIHQNVNRLSTGQQQRVAVARAIIGKPEIIIADEPTSSLDQISRNRFIELLFRESEENGCTLIYVSHDASIAENFHRIIDFHELNKAGK